MTGRSSGNELGSFLRARRAATSVGRLPFVSPRARRVSGLRREEVAMLAGISVDYYTRLEQGRDTHPSDQTLDTLAGALGLDDDQRRHLSGLAGRAWHPPVPGAGEAVNPDLLQLMASWPNAAVFVIDPLHDIVARNDLADALFAPFSASRNLVEMVFLDPAAHAFYADWDRTARSTVASLRAASTFPVPLDTRGTFIARLEAASPVFRELWERQDVFPKTQEVKTFRHPALGAFSVRSFIFELTGAPGYLMVIWQAEPGSDDERKLQALTLRSGAGVHADGAGTDLLTDPAAEGTGPSLR